MTPAAAQSLGWWDRAVPCLACKQRGSRVIPELAPDLNQGPEWKCPGRGTLSGEICYKHTTMAKARETYTKNKSDTFKTRDKAGAKLGFAHFLTIVSPRLLLLLELNLKS